VNPQQNPTKAHGVHEPGFEDVKAILDRAVSFKPRRQVIILFSGGEPTLHPQILEILEAAKDYKK
jgi:uncharacterized radical SAM superfamily Fe-S cluster-containing enzyme